MSSLRKCLAAIIIILFLNGNNFAQQKDLSKTDWVSFGIGFSEKDFLSSYINYTFLNDDSYQLLFDTNSEFKLFRGSYNYFYAVSLSKGFTDISNFGFGGLFFGPSFVYGEEKKNLSIGLNINAQYFFPFSDEIGFGIDSGINLNAIKTFYGIRFGFFLRSML